MSQLILLRHGQSMWNKLNLFTGWVDVPLSPEGIQEALHAGELIKNIPINLIYVSSLIRAQMTAMLAMSVHTSGLVPVLEHSDPQKLQVWSKSYASADSNKTISVIQAWQINERMYGELQGLNKDETRAKYGAEQVHIWRRSYETSPPGGESLQLTAERSIPYFESTIVPQLKSGKNVLVSAHGNSLRAIIMKLDHLSKEEVLKLEIRTGVPIIYQFNNNTFTKLPTNHATPLS